VTYTPAPLSPAKKAVCDGLEYDTKGKTPFCVSAMPYAFGTLPIKPFGDVLSHGVHGLFGAVVVEPKGALILDPKDSSTLTEAERHTLGREATVSYCQTDVCTPKQMERFREFVVFYQDGLNLHWRNPWTGQDDDIKDCLVCDDSYDLGEKGVSYTSAPFWARLRNGLDADGQPLQQDFGAGSNLNHALFPSNFFLPSFRPLSTPTFVAQEGEEVRFRVLQPAGRARQRAFTVLGYDYKDMMPEFGSPASALMSVGKGITARLEGPDLNNDQVADGVQPGCYLYRDGPTQIFAGGVWGSFIVEPKNGTLLACSPQ
jgi:manganese oxidase